MRAGKIRRESQASHGGRSRVRLRNETVFAGFGRVRPEPTVHRLISQIRIYPVGPPHRQVIRRLRLVIVKHHKFCAGRFVPEISQSLLLQ